jgi:pimeloyl-ACP methyl ester carboxylesterase
MARGKNKVPRVRVNGVHLFYEAAGSGRPVILVHAYPVGRRMWGPQVAHLQQRYRVIAYDCRGFGESDAPLDPEEYSQPHSVEDLRGLLRGLGIRRAAVVGLSMGGNIALHFALSHPEQVAGVVICDTGAGSDDATQFRTVTDGWARAAETGGVEAFAAAILGHPVWAGYAARGPAEAAAMRAMITAHPPHAVAHTARGTLGQRPPIFALEEGLRTLPLPSLIVVGERDLPCIAPSKFMADRIPDAQLHVMAGCGHFNNLERPAEFNRILEAFFRRIGWEG